MTDAHLPDRWLTDRRFRRDQLSDAAFRGYMNALMFAVGNRTEGVIRQQDLKYLPDFDHEVIRELIGDGLWEPLGPDRGWLIRDFDTTQTGKDLLEEYEREKAYDRKRKAQARKEALAAKLAAIDESGGSSGGQIPAESHRLGQARQGQEAEGEGNWYAEGEREHLERLADRNVREAYDR